MLFSPAFLTNNLLQCFVRNDGSPSLSMTAMIVESLSKVFLDYIFDFLLRMGIFGAILATGMATGWKTFQGKDMDSLLRDVGK